MIRVLVADALSMSCQLLAEALASNPQFEIVTATNIEQALHLAAHARCHVGLISATLLANPLDSVKFVRQIHACDPELKVVALLDSLDRNLVVEAFRSGALGVFCRTHSFEALCKCILCVHAGQVWASSADLEFVLDALVEPVSIEGHGLPGSRRLSRREEEISQLVAEGFSNRQISERLNLSEHTIKNYLFRVFEKLGVSTRVELTLYALGHSKTLQPKSGTLGSLPSELLDKETLS